MQDVANLDTGLASVLKEIEDNTTTKGTTVVVRPGENSKGFIIVAKPTERRPFFLGAPWTFVTLDPREVLWDTGAQEGLVGKQQLDKWCKLLAEHGLQVESVLFLCQLVWLASTASSDSLLWIRCHFGSRAISVQVNIVAVSDHVFHRFHCDLLIQVSATQFSLFLCVPFVLMATDRAFEDAVHTTLPGSPAPLSSNVGSPYGSAPDLERTDSHPITMEDKINEIYLRLPLFLQNVSRIENCVQTLSQTVAAQTN